jgi:hypothetical protein
MGAVGKRREEKRDKTKEKKEAEQEGKEKEKKASHNVLLHFHSSRTL